MNNWQPSPAEREQYQREGLMLVRNLLTGAEVDRYRDAIDQVVLEYLGGSAPKSEGYERVFVQVHQVFRRHEIMRELSHHPLPAKVAALLGDMSRVRIFLDQVIYKQPGAHATQAHQDAPYLSFDDPRSLNCWIAFDETTVENGALEYFVGSHLQGKTRLVHLDRHDDLLEDFPILRQCSRRMIEARPGDAVFHHCLTVHRSFSNQTTKPRRAFSIQYMPDGARFNGWLHPFMEPYGVRVEDVLDQDCFPLVYPFCGEKHF